MHQYQEIGNIAYKCYGMKRIGLLLVFCLVMWVDSLFAQQPKVDLKPSRTVLYKNCANEVIYDFSKLSDTLNIRFQVLGGELQLHPRYMSRVRFFPIENSVKVVAGHKKDSIIVPLDTITFTVLEIPPPKVTAKIDTAVSKLTVFVDADSLFAKEVPKDARYRIEGITVNVIYPPKMKQEPIAYIDSRKSEVRRFTSLMIDLSEFSLLKGCAIEVVVNKINRINYQDKVIDVTNEIPLYQRTFTINY